RQDPDPRRARLDDELHRAPGAGGSADRALRRGRRARARHRGVRLWLRHIRPLESPGRTGDRLGQARGHGRGRAVGLCPALEESMSLVNYDVEGRVGLVTLNRSDKLNAISLELKKLLIERFHEADRDPATSVVVLRAEGRSFCAGYDIS